MELQNKIVADMRSSLKYGDATLRSDLKVIVGEFQRQGSADLADEEVVKILKKLAKSEQELLKLQGKETSSFLETVNKYVPAAASDDEIRQWIATNVDFSKLKNKMMAMKDVLAHFSTRVDGNTVKRILSEMV